MILNSAVKAIGPASRIAGHFCALYFLIHSAAAFAGVTLWSTGTDTETSIAAELRQRDIHVELQPLDSLVKEQGMLLGRTNTWVLNATKKFPAEALKSVQRHLEHGGELLVLGDVPFQQLTYLHEGNWLTHQEFLQQYAKSIPVFPHLRPESCSVSADINTTGSVLRLEADTSKLPVAATGQALHMDVPLFGSWCTFRAAAPGALPPGELTTFWAKGTTATKKLAIEWQEQDGSRWIATVDLKPEWQYYMLKPSDFKYWIDNKSLGRGGAGDSVNLRQAQALAIGLAQTHTRLSHGPHQFWISDIGIAEGEGELRDFMVEGEIDGLYPPTELYPMQPAALSVNRAYKAKDAGLRVPEDGWSQYWRPMGSGIEKARRHRFIPVVTGINVQGTRAGTIASMMLHFDMQTSGAITAAIGIPDPEVLLSDGWMDIAAAMISRMQNRLMFSEAGSTEFCYDVRDLDRVPVELGYCIIPREGELLTEQEEVLTTFSVANASHTTRSRIPANALQQKWSVAADLNTARTAGPAFLFEAGLTKNGVLVDYISQEVRVESPRADSKSFVTARDRKFWIGEKPWRAFGINYMPSSGLARSHGQEFEHWIEDPAYDPEIVQADLERIKSLGFNMVSVFAYSRGNDRLNLMDLLHRCRGLGLMVNLSLRPNHNPWPAEKKVTDRLITEIRAWERDEIAAYDIAWEPWWGNATQRRRYIKRWLQWVDDKYGSAESAARAWSFSPPDLAAFPSDHQLDVDGEWRLAVADYRRFAHESLNAAYKQTMQNIKALDPNHLVSFRQSEGGNPLVSPSSFPVELAAISDVVDFLSPEGYGIGDAPEKAKTFWFTSAYAQGLAPGKPVLLAEYGASVWSGSAFDTDILLYQRQAQVYENIFNAAQATRAAGTVQWWFPGGYRKFEESDFGLLNPDGTDRPGTTVVKEWAQKLKRYPTPVEWQETLTGDASGVRGYVGLYEQLKSAFYERATTGSFPVVKRSD